LEKTNNETITRFNDSLKLLWTDVGMERRVLLLLTDAASYNLVKAGKSLKIFYTNMIHVTFTAHACNRLAEEVRELFTKVNTLINNGKKIFLKASSRISIYKEEINDIPLPPVPVLTRWGTWVHATLY